MGFFSWNCRVCGKSVRSTYSTDESDAWMREVVAIESDGSIVRGEYDGYGRVGFHELVYSPNEPDLYHRRCYEQAGTPTKYQGGSHPARDQGFFIECE